MIDYRGIEKELTGLLRLERRPIAVAFRDSPPEGVAKFEGVAPSGCTFWRLAAEGRCFYTVPEDHYHCPIGSHTHAIPLPEGRAGELGETLKLMVDAGYLEMKEVPAIPQLARTPGAVVYAPLGDTPVEPDVALFRGRPGAMMLLQEAAIRAGIAAALPLMGRPTCMALPAALAQGSVASSGCVGNRVYTGAGEDELYFAVPGDDLARLATVARTIAGANAALAEYHRERRRSLESR